MDRTIWREQGPDGLLAVVVETPLQYELTVRHGGTTRWAQRFDRGVSYLSDIQQLARVLIGKHWDGRTYSANPACDDRPWHHNGTWCETCRGWA